MYATVFRRENGLIGVNPILSKERVLHEPYLNVFGIELWEVEVHPDYCGGVLYLDIIDDNVVIHTELGKEPNKAYMSFRVINLDCIWRN